MTSMQTKLRRKQGRKSKSLPFVQLHKFMLESPAWLSLSPTARAAYVQLARRYDGCNNGALGLSVRMLADELNKSMNTAARALIELEDAGFIDAVKIGRFNRKRHASEYRLTMYRCDITGELPTKKFMRQKTRPIVSFANSIVSFTPPSEADSSLQCHPRHYKTDFDPSHSVTHDTHIESIPDGSGLGAADPFSLPSSSLSSFAGSNSRENSPARPSDPPWSEQPASSALAWEECYRLARANSGEPGAQLVDLARRNGGATPEDILDAIRASNETGKGLDYELASFLD
jgi:DNA-binding transcriptional ArsR family regulator